MKPLILLDIDGVLSPFLKTDETNLPVENRYGHWLIPTRILNWFARAAAKYEIIWISSWEDESNSINRILGIPAFPYTELRSFDPEWIKKPEVEKFFKKI